MEIRLNDLKRKGDELFLLLCGCIIYSCMPVWCTACSWSWKAADPSVGIWSWVAEYDDSADLHVGALSGSLLKAHSSYLHPL